MASYITASDGSLQPNFFIALGLLLPISCAVVSLRFYCRMLVVRFTGTDDWLMLAALIITIGMSIMNVLHVSWGTGQHSKNLPLEKVLVPTLRYWYVYQLVYPITISMIKFSILAQYHRVFGIQVFRRCIYAVGGFVSLYTLIVVFVSAFECRSKPWRAWDPSFPEGCNDLGAMYFSTAGINILTDMVILIMPMPVISSLKLHKRRRYALYGIFLSGLFASAASIIRLQALWKYLVSKDPPYDAIEILIWSQVEVNVAIVSACAPCLRPLFSRIFKGTTYKRSYGKGSSHLYPGYGPSSARRRTRPDMEGAIELNSQDDERYKWHVSAKSESLSQPGTGHRSGLNSSPHDDSLGNSITRTVQIDRNVEQRETSQIGIAR